MGNIRVTNHERLLTLGNEQRVVEGEVTIIYIIKISLHTFLKEKIKIFCFIFCNFFIGVRFANI